MKWIKLVITILEYIIPVLAKKGKDKLSDELEIAKQTIKVLTVEMSPQDKGRAIEKAIHSLGFVKKFKGRAAKKLESAKFRLYKKLF